jgi:hypothetical protein
LVFYGGKSISQIGRTDSPSRRLHDEERTTAGNNAVKLYAIDCDEMLARWQLRLWTD